MPLLLGNPAVMSGGFRCAPDGLMREAFVNDGTE